MRLLWNWLWFHAGLWRTWAQGDAAFDISLHIPHAVFVFFWSHVSLCSVNSTSVCHPAMSIPPSPRCLAAACGAGGCLRCSRPLRLSHSRMFAVQLCRGRVEVPVRVSKASSHFVLGISPHARPLCESFPQCVSISERRQILHLVHPLLLQPSPFVVSMSPFAAAAALVVQLLGSGDGSMIRRFMTWACVAAATAAVE